MTNRRVLALQPLPTLVWPSADGYSDFPSFGIARLAEDCTTLGLDVVACHPTTRADIADALNVTPDIIVVGDFRYYAYFANPRPQIDAVIRALRHFGWSGPMIVAGRHAGQMTGLAGPGVMVIPNYRSLLTELSSGRLAADLGLGADNDELPDAGLPNMRVLTATQGLPGSRSRTTNAVAQLVLTKGCPFTCAFCEKAGLALTTLSCDRLETALERFTLANVERIVFWDEVFAWPHQQHDEHLAVLADFGMAFNCNARLDSLRPDFIETLARAGCREVLFGLEVIDELDGDSGALLKLDRGKRKTISSIKDRVSMLKDNGIAPIGSVIVGLPSDSKADIARRLETVETLELSHCYVRPLVPFPGSALYRDLAHSGGFAAFEDWSASDYASFPHGYPTLSSLPRSELAAYCGR